MSFVSVSHLDRKPDEAVGDDFLTLLSRHMRSFVLPPTDRSKIKEGMLDGLRRIESALYHEMTVTVSNEAYNDIMLEHIISDVLGTWNDGVTEGGIEVRLDQVTGHHIVLQNSLNHFLFIHLAGSPFHVGYVPHIHGNGDPVPIEGAEENPIVLSSDEDPNSTREADSSFEDGTGQGETQPTASVPTNYSSSEAEDTTKEVDSSIEIVQEETKEDKVERLLARSKARSRTPGRSRVGGRRIAVPDVAVKLEPEEESSFEDGTGHGETQPTAGVPTNAKSHRYSSSESSFEDGFGYGETQPNEFVPDNVFGEMKPKSKANCSDFAPDDSPHPATKGSRFRVKLELKTPPPATKGGRKVLSTPDLEALGPDELKEFQLEFLTENYKEAMADHKKHGFFKKDFLRQLKDHLVDNGVDLSSSESEFEEVSSDEEDSSDAVPVPKNKENAVPKTRNQKAGKIGKAISSIKSAVSASAKKSAVSASAKKPSKKMAAKTEASRVQPKRLTKK